MINIEEVEITNKIGTNWNQVHIVKLHLISVKNSFMYIVQIYAVHNTYVED